MNNVMDQVRKATEDCDNTQGFITTHSLGGGAGSGFKSLLMEQIVDEYLKTCKLDFSIFPCSKVSSFITEPYNAVLSTNSSLNHADCSFLIDNRAIYDVCRTNLKIKTPTFGLMNEIIAQTISSITASLRFEGELNVDLEDFKTNLVPFPRIHFPVTSFAPLVTKFSGCYGNNNIDVMTDACFDNSHQLVKCNSKQGEYTSCCLLYQGKINRNDCSKAVFHLKATEKVKFVDWMPTGFKFGISKKQRVSREQFLSQQQF